LSLLGASVGYLGEEDSTSEILDSEGWLRTGDLCYIDKDGFVYIVDRLKELIKYKGYQVSASVTSFLISILMTQHSIRASDLLQTCSVSLPSPLDPDGIVYVSFRCLLQNSKACFRHTQILLTPQLSRKYTYTQKT